MTGPILNAVLKECRALLSGTGATVMLRTNFLKKGLPDNPGNFILLDFGDAPDSIQYPGGLTRIDWRWGFGSYNFEPDAYVDDETDYSANLLEFIDKIRVHFELGNLGSVPWLTQAMRDIFDTYGFQFTMTGVLNADPVDEVGLILGYKIQFDSTAFDGITVFVNDTKVLETVTQIENPPFDPWILASNFWNDKGQWRDSSFWQD